MNPVLDDAAIAAYWRDGFLVLDDALTMGIPEVSTGAAFFEQQAKADVI